MPHTRPQRKSCIGCDYHREKVTHGGFVVDKCAIKGESKQLLCEVAMQLSGPCPDRGNYSDKDAALNANVPSPNGTGVNGSYMQTQSSGVAPAPPAQGHFGPEHGVTAQGNYIQVGQVSSCRQYVLLEIKPPGIGPSGLPTPTRVKVYDRQTRGPAHGDPQDFNF